MASLIDVDKFIYHHCLECPYRIENSCDEDDPICSSVLDLLDFPTVDAVPVVRCKDCKHYGWEQEPCHGRIQQFCKLHKGLVVVHRGTFCFYGERRTDG